MRLGNSAQFVIGSKYFDESKQFIDGIGLQIIEEGVSPESTRFVLYTDGRSNILLDETREKHNFRGIIYFNKNLEKLIEYIKSIDIDVDRKYSKEKLISVMFVTPNNISITIINASSQDTPNPMGESSVDIGKFGEYAFNVVDLDSSINFWKKLDFESTYRNDELKFAIITDGKLVLGLHSHEMGEGTAITYFNPDMMRQVQRMKENGLELLTEKIGENNSIDATARSPDGQIWYFFTGEI